MEPGDANTDVKPVEIENVDQVVDVETEEERRERQAQEEWDSDFGGRIGEAARAALDPDTSGQFHRLRRRDGSELNVRGLRAPRR